jgi:hypothetical protein
MCGSTPQEDDEDEAKAARPQAPPLCHLEVAQDLEGGWIHDGHDVEGEVVLQAVDRGGDHEERGGARAERHAGGGGVAAALALEQGPGGGELGEL